MARSRNKFKLAPLLLALVLLASSGTAGATARWECLDGHPCGPGCAMARPGHLVAACGSRQAGKPHCPLCHVAPVLTTRSRERCTSSVCVLRLKARPDAALTAPVLFAVDAPAALPNLASTEVVVLPTLRMFPAPPRAPMKLTPFALLLALAPSTAHPLPVKLGQRAPDFTATTIQGKNLRLSALRGKVVLLDFWTTT